MPHYDPAIAVQMFRGLLYTAISISIGVGIGTLLHSLTGGGE